MVVKPLKFIEFDGSHPVQPAVKCRGSEYLRIIYGPEYLHPANLERLRKRGINRKRSLASREFALGIEGLTRFVNRESLRRVHECVFGILALESEPVDPRLYGRFGPLRNRLAKRAFIQFSQTLGIVRRHSSQACNDFFYDSGMNSRWIP